MCANKCIVGNSRSRRFNTTKQFLSMSTSLGELTLKPSKKKTPSSSNKMKFHLFSLPELTIDKILSFLDVKSLKSLRRVCKYTKSWVDRPFIIIRFQLQVKSRKKLKQIFQSQVAWNNFYFKLWRHGTSVPVMEQLFDEFLSKYGQSLKMFRCDITLTYSTISRLLTLSKNLQHLEIEGFYYDCSDTEQELEIVQACHELNLQQLTYVHIFGGTHLNYILQGAPNIRYLSLYRILSNTDSRKICAVIALDAIKIYLNNRSMKTMGPIKPLTIDFGRLGLCNFSINTNFAINSCEFLQLCKLCYQSPSIKFVNVDSESLPCLDTDLFMNRPLQKCLQHITTINVFSNSMSYKYVPPRSELNIQIEIKEQDFSQFYLPQKDQITSLCLMVNCWAPAFFMSPRNLMSLLDIIFDPRRKALKELQIHRNSTSHWDVINEKLYCINFPNLKKLSIDFLEDSKERFWNLCESLPVLEELKIHDYNISDEYLIGKDDQNPVLLKWKRLKSLTLQYYNANLITDLSLTKVFARMKLELLKMECRIATHLITFDGLKKLVSGEFGLTVQNMIIQKPIDCTMGECKILIRSQCKNIQNFRLVDDQEKQRSNIHCKYIYSEPSRSSNNL